ncbi:hypothetical protein [Pontibacter arcticus]|uniref:Uncharacterized protein n=1 Tax=Pontibacter arcticus TaxID=2080288 RepID=A0A364RGC8_9BACT|nr:hypothetical protein [Pontibacter arcticus]RAU83334.1 hypothetical protein DP923_09000 [Pontibacter arcticus]
MRKLFLFLVLLVAFGCKDKNEEVVPMDNGYAYYPLEVGQYRIYSITNTFYRNNIPETSRFQMREVVADSFQDQTNTLAYKIVRSIRTNENSDWVNDSVMVVTKSDSRVILTKDNTKYIKLIFPVNNNVTWIGDAYNTHIINEDPFPKNKEPYTYSNVGEQFTIEGHTFENTATVVQGKPAYNNVVKYDDRKEVYAKGIGRVYRLFNRIVYCNDSQGNACPYNERYKLNGHERHEILIAHGKE